MKEITVAVRKYQGEEYEFILNLPSYDGETGVLGIEITPYIVVKTPENWCGYNDFFHYNREHNDGYFNWRYHPMWIRRKIIDVCNKNYDKWLKEYYYKPVANYQNKALLYAEKYGVIEYSVHDDTMVFYTSYPMEGKTYRVTVNLDTCQEERVELAKYYKPYDRKICGKLQANYAV